MRTLADYTSRDVAPEDFPSYAAHVEQWQAELHPNGALECFFAAEIVRATWRILNYQPLGPQPASGAVLDHSQAAWLIYRERTNAGIRRNLAELRRIQSDRFLQSHLGFHLPGAASLKLVLPDLKLPKQADTAPVSDHPAAGNPDPAGKSDARASRSNWIERTEAILDAQIQEEARQQLSEFAKCNSEPFPEPEFEAPPATPAVQKPAAPRNAPCPCNSGKKFKHCCGHWSKTAPGKAA